MVDRHSDLLTNLKSQTLQNCLNLRLQSVSANRDQIGRRVFIFRAGQWDPSVCSLDDIFRCNVLYLQRLASEKETQVNGIVAIVDLKGFGLYQARHFTPGHARRIAELIKDSFPIRFQAIHLIHEPWIFGMVLSIIWPFLSGKIQNRIFSHGQSQESLRAHVDAKCLPEDYGGLLDPLHGGSWMQETGSNLFDCLN